MGNVGLASIYKINHLAVERNGFTLIELSIVLVIIGLLVGGILTGQDLINAATLRAQISQIEKYNTSVHTFQLKYGSLPGDMSANCAANFGFATRGTFAGEGDGNGIIEGVSSDGAGQNSGTQGGAGEVVLFWEDLSQAGLIEGGFTGASATTPPAQISTWTSPSLNKILPYAKYSSGGSIYVYVYSYNSQNRFGVSNIYDIATSVGWNGTGLGFKVTDAFNIDKKVDDGLPQTGSVIAQYVNRYDTGGNNLVWSYGGGTSGNGGNNPNPYTIPVSGTNLTCFDNGGNNGQSMQYSTSQNSGAGQNCALSFLFE